MKFINQVAPELREGLEQLPSFDLHNDLSKIRQQEQPARIKSTEVNITQRYIQDADGNEMLIKMYEPIKRDSEALPALLWMHGGGYVLGHPDHDDVICEEFVLEANCVVISPDYRLAPEHPYPAAIEDCYSTLIWLEQSSDMLNIDKSRIAIGGGSAGGGLTAALAILNRDRGGPQLCFQMPLYPMIDHRNITPSSFEIIDDRVWNRENNQTAWSMYLGERANQTIPPYAAPSRVQSLAGLPPVYTCVGQLDPFRDETIDYVSRLIIAGIPVEFHLYPGAFHGFERAVPDAKISIQARSQYIQAMAKALNFNK